MPQRHEFAKSLEALQQEILKMGSLVEKNITRAIEALAKQDLEIMEKVLDTEQTIDQMELEIKTVQPESASDKKVIERKELHLDEDRYVALKNGRPLEISPKEFELLFMLASSPGRVYRREEILNRIWGYDFPADTRTVDVHVRHLRQKIEEDPTQPCYLLTVRGVGYKFTESEES